MTTPADPAGQQLAEERTLPPAPSYSTPTEDYTTDLLTRGQNFLSLIVATLGGAVFTLLCWLVLKQTSLPAFNTSMVTRGLATAGTVVVLAVLGVFVGWWLIDEHRANQRRREAHTTRTAYWNRDSAGVNGTAAPSLPPLELRRPRWRVILTHVVCYLSPAALVVTTTAIPLSATRLYLDGLQVDQGFRTQFLTRMATTWGNQDMNYIDMPSYYPIGWFWLGGRLADLLGIPGWEVFQPWALVSIAAAGCLLVPVWRRLTGSLPVGTAVAVVSVCVVLVTTPEEPYGAIVALGAPAATVLAYRALRGSWYATFGVMIFLGASAAMYTLFTGVIALSVVVLAAIGAVVFSRGRVPIVHLLAIGIGSILIALIAWGPYFWALLNGHPRSGATAQHYLPPEGAQIPLPFLSPSVIGVLCLLGLIYFIVRVADHEVRTMGIATAVFYAWTVASMVAALGGTTLLGFRIDSLIALQLTTAGVLALAELRLIGVRQLYPVRTTSRASRTITVVMVVVLLGAGLHYAQSIPVRNENGIDHAYSDTDGYGERADRFAPDVAQHYDEIDAEIRSHGHEPADTVVLTDETNFMSYYPYYGFQAFTSHYANPLGEFGRRNAAIEAWAAGSWTELSEPADFAAALENAPWREPDVFIFRGSLDDSGGDGGWKTHIAEDIFPNNPNVRFRGLFYNPEVFTDDPSMWHASQIGPFVVVSRDKA